MRLINIVRLKYGVLLEPKTAAAKTTMAIKFVSGDELVLTAAASANNSVLPHAATSSRKLDNAAAAAVAAAAAAAVLQETINGA